MTTQDLYYIYAKNAKKFVRFSSVVSDKEWLKSSVRLVSDNAQVRSITSADSDF